MISHRPIRVVVVDDSILTRRVIAAALESDPDITVVGTASSGAEGLAMAESLRPDVLTLDVEMPGLDGLQVLRTLMDRHPIPVVMVSYLTTAGADTTVRAMLAGAVDFVAKPGGPIMRDLAALRADLLRKVWAAASSRPRRAKPSLMRPPATPEAGKASARPGLARPSSTARAAAGLPFRRLVIIGASTGGPQALEVVLRELPVDASTAYLLVQHMPAGMTSVLATLLNACSALKVREAHANDHLEPGTALLAPGDFHVRLAPGGVVQLDQGPKVHWVRPSVDVALLSAAELYGGCTVATVLTGIGSDGADGAAAIHAAGGYVIAEDASTAVVWGMPKAVVDRNVADSIVPLHDVARTISTQLGRIGARQVPVRA
jgi:two-component system chemotaxis response regulator CheB